MIRLLPVLFFSGLSAWAQTGQIVITVQNSAAAAVPNALVRVSARPFKNVLPNYHTSQKAGADGKATFSGLTEGSYEVCAQLPGSLLLDSCSWINRPPAAYLHAGATLNLPVVLHQGAKVNIQVTDNSKLLASEVYPGQKLHLEVSLKDAHSVPMSIASTTGTLRQFAALVPADADLRLQVRSNSLQLADSSGTKLNMKDFTQVIPLHSPPAPTGIQPLAAVAATPVLTLQVVGLQ